MFRNLSLAALTVAMMAGSAQAAMADETTYLWGYYQGNSVDELAGVGVSAAASYEFAMLIPAGSAVDGATIQSINLPIQSKTNMTDISVWVAQADGKMTRITEQTVDKADLTNNSFNTIALSEPVAVSGSVFVGASFTLTRATSNPDKYPILFDQGCQEPKSMYLNFSTGQGWSGWDDYTSQFGALALQVNISGLDIKETNATFKPLTGCFTMPGKEYTFKATVNSTASEAVENIEYVVEMDGQSQTCTADVAIPAGLDKSGIVNINIVGPAEIGGHTVKMNITKVNGKDNSAADVVTESVISNVEKLAVRRTVVEEFTGTGCPWCSRGLLGMDLLKKTYPDTFVGIGIHQYNNSDPMYFPTYPVFGMTGAPSCIIDRKEILDPFFGSTEKSPFICYDFDRYNAVIAPVDIELTATWEDGIDFEGTDLKVNLTAVTTAILEGDYTIDFVLTADSLHNTSSSSWRQANNYASYTKAQVPEELYPIVKGGEYGSSYFYYPFDDVLIASSYKKTGANLRNQADALGYMTVGQSVESTFTLSLPTKSALLNTIKDCSLNKIHGIVVVCDAEGHVANAARVLVTKSGDSGIEQVKVEKATERSYDLQGRETSNTKGLMIRGGKVIFND